MSSNSEKRNNRAEERKTKGKRRREGDGGVHGEREDRLQQRMKMRWREIKKDGDRGEGRIEKISRTREQRLL